jgi:hypothetical protein
MSELELLIVIVNSKLLKRYLKAKRWAPANSRALRQVRGGFRGIREARNSPVSRSPERGRADVKAGDDKVEKN